MASSSDEKTSEILQTMASKRLECANELTALKGRIGAMIEHFENGMSTKQSSGDDRFSLIGNSTKLEYMSSKYNYILPAVHIVITKIPDKSLRHKMEYLLNDYRRMWQRRHTAGLQQGDTVLTEIKSWTDENRKNVVLPIAENEKYHNDEAETAQMKKDIDMHLEKIRNFQGKVAKLKDTLFKMSAEDTLQIGREQETDGFSFESALRRMQEMPADDYVGSDSLDDLIKEIDTLETLTAEQRLRLTHLFQTEQLICEDIERAKQCSLEAEMCQTRQKTQQQRLKTLERDWFQTQEKLFDVLYSYAEPILLQLKYHQCTEARDSIIASESIKEYERMLSAEKKYSSQNGCTAATLKTNRVSPLLSLVTIPDLKQLAMDVLSSLNDSKEVCSELSKQAFDRISLESKEIRWSAETNNMMGRKADISIESDWIKLRDKAKDGKSYHSLINNMFRIITRILKEYSRVLKVQRLRDLQMSTLVHNIDLSAQVVAGSIVSVETHLPFPACPGSASFEYQKKSVGVGKSTYFNGKTCLKPMQNFTKENMKKTAIKRRDENKKSGADVFKKAFKCPRQNIYFPSKSLDTNQEKKKPPSHQSEKLTNIPDGQHDLIPTRSLPEWDEQEHRDVHICQSEDNKLKGLLNCSDHIKATKRNTVKVYKCKSETSVTPWNIKI